MNVSFETTIPDGEGGFTLEARFQDVAPNSTAIELGERIGRRITEILALDAQNLKFEVWGMELQSGVYAGRKFAITGPGSDVAATTRVSVLAGGAPRSLEINVFGQLIELNAAPLLVPPGTLQYREKQAKKGRDNRYSLKKKKEDEEEVVSLKRRSSMTPMRKDEMVPPPLDSPEFPRVPVPDTLFDDLFGETPDVKKYKVGCEMCKTKLGVLSCKQRKNVAYCGVACYLKHKSQKKD